MAVIRTVLGDVPSEQAGITLAHEHILYAYPGADLDHRTQFDFEEIADQVAGVATRGREENGILADFARRAGLPLRVQLGRQWLAFSAARRRDQTPAG